MKKSENICPICDVTGNKSKKAHVLPKSLGFTKFVLVVENKKCKCDHIIGTHCINALIDCNLYNYHNYKKNKKINISSLQELNKLDWKISKKNIVKSTMNVKKDEKIRVKFIKKGKYGKLRIQTCPSGVYSKFEQFLDKKPDTATASATMQKNAYKIYFCLIHALLLIDFDKKILGKRSPITKKSINTIKMLLKYYCENKFDIFKDRSADWEYTKDEKYQYINFLNKIGIGGLVYRKDKMVSFICGVATNINYYVYFVNTLKWTVSKEKLTIINGKIKRGF